MHIVLTALNYYFIANTTLRKASLLLSAGHNVYVSHVTISNWATRFAPVFQAIATTLQKQIDLSASDEWHFDETYVKINGKNYYLWLVIDAETRFVLDFHDVISNNLIEAFNGQFKAWYNPKRAFGSFDSANRLIATFIYHYNFLRPHSSLDNLTPAQVAGLHSSKRSRDNWFLIA